METTYLTEYDLISIGDDVALNDECTIQTHLFEDRVMKMSTIDIQRACSVGCGSIVLYDTRMEAGAVLSDLSLLMKGETLPAGTRWEGTPARSTPAGAGGASGPASPAPAPVLAIRVLHRPEELRCQGPGPFVWAFDLDSPAFAPAPDGDGPLAHGDGPLRRRRTFAGRQTLRRLVAQCLHVRAEDVQIDSDTFGRPRLAAGRMTSCPAAADLDFSAAHSANVGVVGLARSGRIGVDVEVVDPAVDIDEVIRTHFAPPERERIEAMPDSRRQEAFYRCWTTKEALVKGLGLGVSFGLDQVETAVAPDGSVSLSKVNGNGTLAAGWTITHHEVAVGGLRAVVAVAIAPPAR
jgi:phosphopantetheinyl transferase